MSNSLILSKLEHPIFMAGHPVASPVQPVKGYANGKQVARPIILPDWQAIGYASRREVVTHPSVNSIPATAFSTGAQYDFFLKAKSMKRITGMTLRFQIQETAASSMILVPTAQMVNRIEFWTQKGPKKLFWQYGDTLLFKECANLSTEQFTINRQRNNISANYYSTAEQTHKASETKWYDLQFIVNPLELLRVDMGELENDIRITIYFRNAIVVSGSGNPQLNQIQLLASENDDNGNLNYGAEGKAILSKYVPAAQFLDVHQI